MKHGLPSIFVLVTSLLLAGLVAPARLPAAGPRLETKLAPDSTIFTLKVDPKEKIQAGRTFTARIHVQVGNHWHVYSSMMSADGGLVPLSLTLPESVATHYQIVKLTETGKLVMNYDSNFAMETKAHYTPFDLIVTLKATQNSKTKVPLSFLIHYQTCNESMCLPPRYFAVPMTILGQQPLELSIAEGVGDSSAANRAGVDTAFSVTSTSASNGDSSKSASVVVPSKPMPSDRVAGPQKAFSLHYLLVALLAGLGALLTPCVYPMVPITVSFFTKRNAGSRKEATKDALLYGFGIIFTFVVLGLLLTLLFGGSGRSAGGLSTFAANPVVNVLFALLYVAFALNLFGLFEIGLPSSVLSKLNSTAQQSKSRVTSVMLMGFVFSLTSFTCSVPFVGTAFVDFMHGSFLTPILGMTIFASVFALPFVLLALVPTLVKSMPRSGGWLNSVKVVMGFLEVAIALRYFANADVIWSWHIFSRDLVLAAWVAIAIITTVYLLGRFQLSHDTPVDHIGAIRAMLAVATLSIAVYLYTGFHGKSLGTMDGFLPPADEADLVVPTGGAGGSQSMAVAQQWIPRYEEALAEARRTKKNIFIDFTGYTCTNCRAMEHTIFSRPDVQSIFKNFVLARLYTDKANDPLNDSNRLMEESRFNTIALPYYAIVSPDDKPLSTFPEGYTRDAEAFKNFLLLQKADMRTVASLGQ